MKYSFKPVQNLHIFWMTLFYIFPVSVFDVSFFINVFHNFDFIFMIICIILTIFPLIVYILFRLFYPFKYVINDEYLVKYKNNKIVFKIKKSDIKYILIKKNNCFDYFKFFISMIICDFSTKRITTASIVFEKCDFLDKSIKYELKRIPIANMNDENLEQYVEVLPLRKIKKICTIIGKEYKILKDSNADSCACYKRMDK